MNNQIEWKQLLISLKSLSNNEILKVLKYLPEFSIFLLLFLSYLYPRLHNPFLVSYAGLYMQISETIVQNKFSLPYSIAYYGPGGMPFTYPPLGFYLCAIVVKILDISVITYARYFPVAFYTGSLITLYFLVRTITKNRAKGIITAFLYGISNIGYLYHAEESGMVRGLALFFVFAGLIGFYYVLNEKPKNRYIILAILGLACTALTSFTYLVFFLVSILVLIFFSSAKFMRRIKITLIICAIAAFLTTPWFITIISRHGLKTIISAGGTHGGLFTFLRFTSFDSFFSNLLNIFYEWKGIDASMISLALIGVCYLLIQRKRLFPVWLIAIFFFVGENGRFLFVIGTAIAAELIVDIFDQTLRRLPSIPIALSNKVLWLFSITIILFYFWGNFFIKMKDIRSLDYDSLMELAGWFRDNTGENESYLLISPYGDFGYNENLPYFINRNPTVLPWGSEWTNSFEDQLRMSQLIGDCYVKDSFDCVLSLMEKKNLAPDYLITYNTKNHITSEMRASTTWHEVHDNNKFIVTRKKR